MLTPSKIKAGRNAIPLLQWTKRLVITLTISIWFALSFWVIGKIASALLMFAIAALLAYAFYPLVKFVQRVLPRGLSILTVFLCLVAALVGLVYIFIRIAIQQAKIFITYVREAITSPEQGPLSFVTDQLNNLGISRQQIQAVSLDIIRQVQGIVSGAIPFVSSIFGIILNALLVAALCVYILFTGPRIVNWLRYKTPLSQRENINYLLETFKHVAGGYIRGQLLLSTILSTITALFMSIIGVPLSFFLGILAFMLSFIPTIGAFTTGTICVLLALTQGWVTALLALAFLIFLQVLETQILSPRIVGSAVGLHPLAALMALIIGGELFGATGALFAAPVAGIVQALLIAIWKTWSIRHPEQFNADDDRLMAEANAQEEQGKPSSKGQ